MSKQLLEQVMNNPNARSQEELEQLALNDARAMVGFWETPWW